MAARPAGSLASVGDAASNSHRFGTWRAPRATRVDVGGTPTRTFEGAPIIFGQSATQSDRVADPSKAMKEHHGTGIKLPLHDCSPQWHHPNRRERQRLSCRAGSP